MHEIYEPSNPLSLPFECFSYSSQLAPFPIRPHRHYFAELLFARSGRLIVHSENREYQLVPGEAFIVFPNTTHSIEAVEDEAVNYDVIKLDINQFSESPAYAPSLRDVIEDASLHKMEPHFTVEQAGAMRLSEHFTECIREYQSRVYGYDLMIKSTMYLMLTQILRHWLRQGLTLEPHVFRSELFGSVSSITSFIESHLRDSLKVDDLARYCGMSYPSFARKFRTLYGISCKEYIEQVRVAQVEHFLLFTDCELNFISQETGYADCSHMIRDFKRLRGVTPGQYRLDRKHTIH